MKFELVENWAQKLWKLWSIRLAWLAGVVGAYFFAYPAELQRIVALVPEGYREPASVLAGLAIFAAASGARLVRQGGATPPPDPEP